MTLYHFHIRHSGGLVEDEEGMDLPDLPAVLREVLRSCREYFTDAPLPEAMTFQVTDEAGRKVLQFPLVDLTQKPVQPH